MTGAHSRDPGDHGPGGNHQPEADQDQQLEATQTGEQAPEPETDKPDKDKKDRNMAELTIRPEEIRDALERFVATYEPGAASTEEAERQPNS